MATFILICAAAFAADTQPARFDDNGFPRG